MAYDPEELVKVQHLKELAQRIKDGYATKEALKEISDAVGNIEIFLKTI